MEPKISLLDIPPELIRNIALFIKSPLKILLVSKRFGFLRDDKLFWKQKVQIDYPKLKTSNNKEHK